MNGFLRALTLAVISAVTAEFLLGDQYLSGMAPAGQQIAQLVLFVAFYGSAAVLIREITRRTGRGWPTILLLALAFGVLEEGVVTQSLFNPDYVGQHLIASGFIPGLGTAGPWLVFVLTLHVVWSIGSPIAIAEALGRDSARGSRPWLGAAGLIIASVLFVLGGVAIFFASAAAGFMAPWWRLAIAAAVALVLVVVALSLPRRNPVARRSRARSLPTPDERPVSRAATGRRIGRWLSFLIALVLATAFQLVHQFGTSDSPWLTTLAMLAVIGAGIAIAFTLRPDAFSLAAGAVVTYCWVGLVNAAATDTAAIVEQSALVAIALATLALAARRSQPARLPVIDLPEERLTKQK